MEDASDSESHGIGVPCVEWVLGTAQSPLGHGGQVGRAARQGASGNGQAAPCAAEQAKRGERSHDSGYGSGGDKAGSGPSWCTRRLPRHYSRSEMPSWLSDASVDGSRTRVGKAAGEKGRLLKRRSTRCEPWARERGFPRVLVTTDRLQRLVSGILFPTGRWRVRALATRGKLTKSWRP